MKKTILAIALAVTSGVAAPALAADLNFDEASVPGEVRVCELDAETGVEECQTRAYLSQLEALNAMRATTDAVTAKVAADEEVTAAVFENSEAKAALQLLLLDIDATDSDIEQAEALVDTTASALAAKSAAAASAAEVYEEALAVSSGYAAAEFDAVRALHEAQSALTAAQENVTAAETAKSLAAAEALIGEKAVSSAQAALDAASANYIAATEAAAGDEGDDVLLANKLDAANAYLEASSELEVVEAEYAEAFLNKQQAELAVAAATEALGAAQASELAVRGDVFDSLESWEDNLDSNIASAEKKLADAKAVRDSALLDVAAKQTDAGAVESDLALAEAAAEAASASLEEAEIARDEAEAVLLALGSDASDAEILAATVSLDAARTAAATALVISSEADVAVTVLTAELVVAENRVAAAQTVADAAGIVVTSKNADLLSVTAEREVHAAYIGNELNPANNLMDALISTDDHAQAVVTAISDTYEFTVTNAEGIAVNTTGIATNKADIAVNTTGIATNKADIAVNTTGIATNKADIALNTAGVARLTEGLDILRSGVAASLATNAMPMAPGDGWGFALGTGYFDGESAVAAGLSYRATKYNFKFSVGSSGGETTASAGMAWDL